MTSLTLSGNVGGNTGTVNSGGTFHFTSNVAGVYDIVISRDGINFDPTLSTNRSLRGVRGAGAQTVTWNGQDNGGSALPVGTSTRQAASHGGDGHVARSDGE